MKEITPVEAWALLEQEPDALLVDVRSQGEFTAGHPAGALNVPIAEPDPRLGGMVANPEFLDAMKALVPDRAQLVLFTCRSGARSRRAGELLEAAGYGRVVNVDGGFAGNPDVTGWADSDLPTSLENGEGVSWPSIRKQRLGR